MKKILVLILVIAAFAYGNYAQTDTTAEATAEANTAAKATITAEATITTEAATTTEADSTAENGSIAEADAAADSDVPAENGTTTPTDPEPTDPEPDPITEAWTHDGEYKLSFFLVTSQESNPVSYHTRDDIMNKLFEVAAANPKEAGEDWLVENMEQFSEYDIAFYTLGGNWAMRCSTMGKANEISVESITLYGYEEDASHTISNALSHRRVLRKVDGGTENILEEFQGKDGFYEGADYVSLILPDIDHGCWVTAITVSFLIDGRNYDIDIANWPMLDLPPC